MHSVLDLKSDGSDAEADQPLEKALIQACLRGFLAHDYGAQLAVIADKNDVFGTLEERYERLRLRGLSGLIDKHLLEFQMLQPLIESTDTRRADNIGIAEDFIFCLSLQFFVKFVILLAELSIHFFGKTELLHFLELAVLEMLYLFMK